MTRIEKLEASNKQIQQATITNDIAFFTILFPEKMTNFLNLTYFNEINNDKFHFYLDAFRTDVLMATINWCKESKLSETDWQKEYTLRRCKENVHATLNVVHWAFEYYIENKELLTKEED